MMSFKSFTDHLFSMKAMLVVLFIMAVACAAATFIENDYGPETARAVVYNTRWFEALYAYLVVNFIANIFTYRMWRPAKIFSFMLHLSLILILIGAMVTRYFGYEGMMHIREGETVSHILSTDTYVQLRVGDKEIDWPVLISQMGSNSFTYTENIDGKEFAVSYINHSGGRQKQLSVRVSYNGEERTFNLVGGQGLEGIPQRITIGGLNAVLAYGAKPLPLPFGLELERFALDRYPGSNSPASYSSYVIIHDEELGAPKPFHIYMNHILVHQGFRFYQSSYDTDELGTYLSVSKDPGKLPTYIGYFFLTVGLAVSLFMPQGRCRILLRQLSTAKATQTAKAAAVALLAGAMLVLNPLSVQAFPEYANQEDAEAQIQEAQPAAEQQQPPQQRMQRQRPVMPVPDQFDLRHSQEFGKLLVLDAAIGRIKPMDTFTSELLYKIARTVTLEGFTPNQVIMGMMVDPFAWQYMEMIRVEHPQLRRILGITDDNQRRTSFASFFDERDQYVLLPYVEAAYQKDPSLRNTFDRGVITVDERVSIAYMIYTGMLWKFFPRQEGTTNTWYTITEAMERFPEDQRREVMRLYGNYFTAVEQAIQSGNWSNADRFVQEIRQYQRDHDPTEAIPSEAEVKAELFLNKYSIFKNLMPYFLFVGLAFLAGALARMFIPVNKGKGKKNLLDKYYPMFHNLMFALVALGFVAFTIGLGVRWYVSGHAPMSNAYESMIYIAWSTVLAGLAFHRKQYAAAPAAAVMCAIALMVAHLSNMNPQITNLVPVLKSYWLVYHVAVITASYGFFALSLLLGMLVLVMYAVRSEKRPHLDTSIRDMMIINRISMIVGLGLFTIGNFLGAVWANESWGRYWGWDPKETWSLIIILIYALVIHMDMIPKLKNKYYWIAIGSVLSFSTVLMTYFGVNFYLSGLHSYAGGDPMPIPSWVWYSLVVITALFVVSYPKRDGKMPLARES
ncbi:cytochrome c biogenesis protein CcsA [Desulfurispirillum indicum]|uniref:Cytochrome c assembly protein n=1 Tax=Desulfurispirillum indicum (strain ATCC BAA-1389 / DSM 22839 / S5) TaxID=653733 RepID=E6W4H8_DESIS|nr:cytochrome c biogenesis protein CcsA [Desulfurispirillum indicum]ADU67051.1 cytochrome c assembly protein [Desulfurispirillum indicum S5]UCZ56282.1 cytochrome c biogenesis protein CcsA [Desulfurispirillum indicum]